jgi:hypothetical protein
LEILKKIAVFNRKLVKEMVGEEHVETS